MNNEIYTHIGYDLILSEIEEKTKVLDLGCGDGALLVMLQHQKQAHAFGVEISEYGVSQCVEKGLFCIQGDIDEGLSDYKDNSFDYVILNQTLQSTKRPYYVLNEIMRISKNAIIGFPNFGYYKTRFQLLFKGRMPKNELLPYEWYESPNYHHLTIRDFCCLCSENSYPIKKQFHFSIQSDGHSKEIKFLPNFTAQFGLFILDGEKFTRGEVSPQKSC